MRAARRPLLCLCIVGAWLALRTLSLAAAQPEPTLVASPAAGPAGTLVTLTGSGYPPDEPVFIMFGLDDGSGGIGLIDQCQTDGVGALLNCTFTVPDNSPGDWQLAIMLSDFTVSATTTFTIQGPATPVPTATDTPVPTATPTNTPTPTAPPTDTPTPTALPTDTPTPTALPTDTPTPTALPTDTPAPTALPTDTSTPTALPSDTALPTPMPTATGSATPADTPTPATPHINGTIAADPQGSAAAHTSSPAPTTAGASTTPSEAQPVRRTCETSAAAEPSAPDGYVTDPAGFQGRTHAVFGSELDTLAKRDAFRSGLPEETSRMGVNDAIARGCSTSWMRAHLDELGPH